MNKKWLAVLTVLACLTAAMCVPVLDSFALDHVEVLFDPSFSAAQQPVPQPASEQVEQPALVELVQRITPEPTPEPTAVPTPEPTAAPTPEPTAAPTPEPTVVPTPEPTSVLTPEPTAAPTPEPTAVPTQEPTFEPTAEPSSGLVSEAMPAPTSEPTPELTDGPIVEATTTPSEEPTEGLESSPNPTPDAAPSQEPAESQEPEDDADAASELKLSLKSESNYAYAGQHAIRVHAGIEGGKPDYTLSIEVYNGSSLVDQLEETYSQPRNMEFVWMPSDYGVHTVRFSVVDGSGQCAKASVELPVAISERETQTDWERSVADVVLTGDWREDLVAVAQSQIGYTENHHDFILDETGKKYCYSRYGDWYGYPHSDWCAMFVAFCLNYAGISEDFYPYDAGCSSLKEKLVQRRAYEDNEKSYKPQSGDLVFFNHEGENKPQHVGIVESVENHVIYTIEGNVDNGVVRKQYEHQDKQIVGYANTSKLMADALVVFLPKPTMEPAVDGTTAVTLTNAVNIRRGTDTNSRRLGKVNKAGTRVNVLGTVMNQDVLWYYVQHEDVKGFIRSDLLMLESAQQEAENTQTPEEVVPTPTPIGKITIDETQMPDPTLAPDIPDGYACGFLEHTHDETCMDEHGALVCSLEEHVHDPNVCLTYAEQEVVDALHALLMLLPAVDEIESRMMELEEADDMSALETYLRSVIPDYRKAYNQYQALSDKLKAHVQGFERVLDLEWLWSAFILYDYPALADDSAYVSDLTVTKIAPQEKVASGQQVSFTFSFDMLSYTDTNYGEGRVKIEAVLPYEETQAAFDLAAMSWLDQTESYAPSISSETRTIDGEETACQVLNGFVHLTTGEMDGYVIPGSFEGNLVVTIKELAHHAPVFVQISAAMEHGTWEGECTAHGRTEKLTAVSDRIEVYVPLTQEEQSAVDSLNEMIAALPMADEVEAVMTALDAADDMESLERYIRDHAPRFREAYLLYETLTDRQKEEITGFDKVLDLEWFWSAFILYDYPALEDDSARVSAITVAGSQEQVMLGDSLLFQFKADTESYTDTNYGEGRMKIEVVLPLSAEQATFDLEAMTWLDRAEGYAPEIAGATCQIDGEETACQILTGFVHLTTGDLEGYAIPGSFEGGIVVKTNDLPHRHPVFVQLSAALEHSAWEDICPTHQAIEKHTVISNQIIVCVPPTPEEQVQIDALNALLSALPTVDDVELIINAFETAGDMAGLEAYMREIVPQFREAYLAYEAMNERQKEDVVGFEKVLDLEWFWSAFILYDYPPLEDDSARVSSLMMTDVKPLDQAILGEVISFGFKLNTESYTDTNYGEGRAKIEAVLPFDSEQAAYALNAMGWLDRTEGYAPVVTSETRVIDGAEMVCQVLTGFVYLTTGELQSYAIPGSFEGSIAVKTKELAHGTPVYVQLSAALEHGAWDGECPAHQSAEKHSAVSEPVVVLVPLTQEQLAQVDALNALLASLPTADDVELIINAFEGAGDLAGLEAYMREIVPQFREAYNLYQAMNDQQREAVVGFEKVLDLEWFWSAFILYDYPELTDDSAYVSALTLGALSVETANPQAFTPEDTVKNGDAVRYPFTVSTESYTDTNYGEGRVKLEIVLPLSAEQAAFDLDAMTWLDSEEGYAPEIAIQTRMIDGAETVCQILTGFVHMTTGSLDGYAIPGEFTHNVVVKLIAAEPGTHFALEISAAMEHAAWEGECEVHQKLEKCTVTVDRLMVIFELSETDWARVQNVILLIDAMPSADEIDAALLAYEEAEDFEGYEAYYMQVVEQVNAAYMAYSELPEELKKLVHNADKLLELEYIWSAALLIEDIPWTAPTPIGSASTKDFVDLNLYDYSANINTNYNKNNNWPGFQWNGGAYKYSETYNRHAIDFIDFGNSMITNFKYAGSGNGKSTTAMNIGNHGGNINKIVEYPSGDWANRPVGMSTGTEVLSRTLSEKGYPWVINAGSMVDYFSDSSIADKKNSSSIDGLFQKNATSGEYYFNSRENHAQYSNNRFTLYREMLTPNFITYPFGNFLPFNKINDQTVATPIFNVTAGRLDDYLQGIINDLVDGTEDATEQQLIDMLAEYRDNLKIVATSGGNAWTTWSAANAIADYITSGAAPDAIFSMNSHPITKLYNIDYDVETNFFFGMDMSMNFIQPKGGMTGTNNAYPMEFRFEGDDDVWVFIDGVLFLDLSGIHRHVGGKIDFVNGKVTYSGLSPADGEAINGYKTYTFEELLTAAGKSTEGLNSKGTFKDYTSHSFKFYYMERGSGSSVCKINFNFPMLQQNTISVTKELSPYSDDVTPLGEPEYKFQILKADSSGKKTNALFIGSGVTYNLYKGDTFTGEKIGTGTTDADGVFTLKAGQTAEFTGINENSGMYYVRELLTGNVLEQYGEITVSGESTTQTSGITVGSDTFTGVDSPVKDMSDGSTAFRFDNKFTADKLGDLIIEKIAVMHGTTPESEFAFTVKLDGELVPKDTPYAVYWKNGTLEERKVTEAGQVLVPADAKVKISGILAGTWYEVSESPDKEYDMSWTSEKGMIQAEYNTVSGTIEIPDTTNPQKATAIATNTEKGISIKIPVTKTLVGSDGEDRTFVFRLVQCDQTGTPLENAFSMEKMLSLGKEASSVFDEDMFAFSIGATELTDGENAFYFLITEKEGDESGVVYDETQFLVTLILVKDAVTGIPSMKSLTICRLTDSDTQYDSASFVNALTGDLTVSKTVVGASTDRMFPFTIELSVGDSGLDKLPDQFDVTLNHANGTTERMLLPFPNGKLSFTMGHGESLTVHGVPFGAKYIVEETPQDGYWVVIDQNYTPTALGSMTLDGAVIAYNNITTYELPESGGRGTTLLYIAGAMLTLVSAALLYNHKRRKGESML